jgi:hypothetical protein
MSSVMEYLQSTFPMTLTIKPTSPVEIVGIIKKLINNKSLSHDLIFNKVVKSLPLKAIVHLTYIYNASLWLSYFPTTWKASVILTVLNPGKPSEIPFSYRPISLLPVLTKILDKIIHKRITTVAQSKNTIPNFQFSFRAHHATTRQLHRVRTLSPQHSKPKNIAPVSFWTSRKRLIPSVIMVSSSN